MNNEDLIISKNLFITTYQIAYAKKVILNFIFYILYSKQKAQIECTQLW